MTTPLTILTGASRGLGLAVAEQLLQRGHRVLALSRRVPTLPTAPGDGWIHWAIDLADAEAVARRLTAWLAEQDAATLTSVTLIHNAGVLARPAPLSASDPADLGRALRVGLEAPLLLTAAFLRATDAWPVPRQVLLVSSGLGRRAMAGSAAYCAAKAGLDHLARALALEEAAKPMGAKVVSLAPGVIDTDMQVQLREADAGLFPARETFDGLHRNGQLDSPETAARKLLAFLDRPDYGANPIGDVRDAAPAHMAPK